MVETVTIEKRLSINSDIAKIQAVRQSVLLEMAGHNFDEESKMAVAVALDECLTNAIKHGNKNNKKLLVEITYKINSAGVEITIKDQGSGFDWRGSTRLRGGDDFTGYELCGRGLFMINNMMTSVAYNDNGNQVTIIRSNLN
ncbi:MAG: hypothetical protein A2008_03275 [Candidatus Wallbacteria bacterium GWC2_49_35]|uniref:Histidine kinase/HSP90-like ATPase domain-containing protein n=1 Tax=Candidatus Wallbacteria bacterium GWC2_49_35 TaxID=1817813 RepID=A0A1F7WM37_9BACT|nr:MAG: hypothetical protein A2008_03275 [Candidatus Wallbacteria bacterium GWC2_49_35]HBC73495.1 hypothetical protein [Candidatus Wallbacteria bacterium]